jgi:RNA polymerase sigma factor (TIGR02999 family)
MPEITDLLKALNNGDSQALDKLLRLAYAELKKIARSYMRREKDGHMLQTTALVNEAVLKLIREKRITWESRRQFYAILARRMRQVLIDYANHYHTAEQIGISEVVFRDKSSEIRLLNAALHKFASVDKRAAEIVELRYFGGYSVNEVAEILNLGTATVERKTRFARSWLWREMTGKVNQ